MSPSKPAVGAKSKTKAKAKPAAAAKRGAVETLRIIPAPQPATLPDAALSAADKASSVQAKTLGDAAARGAATLGGAVGKTIAVVNGLLASHASA